MVIERKDPKYPRQGPSCLLVLFVIFGIVVAGFVMQNRDEVLEIIIPTPTAEPTRSATEFALLASLSLDDDDVPAAIDYLENALRLDSTKVQFFTDLINLYVETAQPELALEKAEDAIVLAPDNEDVWTAYAAAHIANADRLSNMGDISGAHLEYAQAVEKAQRATAINPQNATALAYIAGGLISQGIPELYEQAQFRAEEAVLLEQDNAIAHYYLATVYTNQGYRDLARAEWQLGIQADDRNPNLYMGLAYNFFADGRVPDAILRFQEAIEIDEDNAEAYDGLAYMYLQLGQHVKAQENALIAIQLDPNMARAHGRLGEAYFLQNNYELAIEALINATALYGKATDLNSRFFYYLGSSYLALGTENCDKAVPLFREVADIFSFFQEPAQEGLVTCRRVELEQGE
ncbi:MAG: tetratricopeptide repeat protein [Chloroflexi bacterium]|nr:tetratricopeptide repeat protein [Chloroflexota bacterium]